MAIPDKAELWAAFARAAMSNYDEPDKVGSEDELADDMARVSTLYADNMLKEFERRFDDKGKKRRRKLDEEDEEEEDEDDEDDED